VAFAFGSVGPFFALDWPPLLRQMLLGYLVAVLVTRIAVVVGHFLLAPNDERFRIVPTDNVARAVLVPTAHRVRRLVGLRVESRCGAVVLGRPCRLPPLSSGGALVGRP